jgi:hypothetical protein
MTTRVGLQGNGDSTDRPSDDHLRLESTRRRAHEYVLVPRRVVGAMAWSLFGSRTLTVPPRTLEKMNAARDEHGRRAGTVHRARI